MDINMCNYSKTAQMLVVARLVRRHSCSILSWCPAFGKASVCWCWWCHWIIWDMGILCGLPSGKHTKNYGESAFFMGKSTISTGPFSSSQTLCLPVDSVWMNHDEPVDFKTATTWVCGCGMEQSVPQPRGFVSLGFSFQIWMQNQHELKK